MAVIASNVKRWGVQDSLWLCLAIVVHALLLLIPVLKRDRATIDPAYLNVTLIAPAMTEKPFVEEPESSKTEIPAVENETAAPDDQPAPELATLEEPKDRSDQELPGKEVILTTARLLDSAGEAEWPAPVVDDSRKLGIFAPQPMPDNWRSGRIENDILHPMVLPGKTEIVDRWLAADGSQNLIINTSDGQTLCGRALAWDPMQPLIEYVMQFRLCGGGEKRTFEMTQRIKRLTSSPL